MPKSDDDSALLRRLGAQLRRLREQSGQSQDTLANRCGLHRTYVGAVERGERNPTVLSLKRYADGLGVSIADLVEGF
jgi:transcriptional regulator with XRE-family HTH domain